MQLNQQHPPLHILLADDDADDRYFFNKALNEIPIATVLTIVHNGEQLMDHLHHNSNGQSTTDILFLDISMPRKTGFECLVEIKENKELKDLPVVMFTTSFTRGIDFEDNLKNTLSSMGALDYIRKPNDFEDLKQLIHEALIKIVEKKQVTDSGN